MSLESTISELPGSVAVEAAYTLASFQLQLELPEDAMTLMAARFTPEQQAAATELARKLSESRDDVDQFARYVLLSAAEFETDKHEVVLSVDSAGKRAFLEDATVLQGLLIIGALYLANLKVGFERTTKKVSKNGESTEQTSTKLNFQSRVKISDFLKLFGITPDE
jgi:hypothetical protein